jgi:hypothetical protein
MRRIRGKHEGVLAFAILVLLSSTVSSVSAEPEERLQAVTLADHSAHSIAGTLAVLANDAFSGVHDVFEVASDTHPLASVMRVEEGSMTGGGSVFTIPGLQVTHGFELNCDGSSPNNLQVNWDEHVFHLENLTAFGCEDREINEFPPEAGFDTYSGLGTGRLDGIPGARIVFLFTDAGEPGTNDLAQIRISVDGNTVLFVRNFLTSGNHQALP